MTVTGTGIPLAATQATAEGGEDVRTIDDTRDGAYLPVKSSVTGKIIPNMPRREREENDWYVEPESVTSRLLAVERPFIGDVHDPCCGQGNTLRAMQKAGILGASGSDIVLREPCDIGGCFTQTLPALMPDSVISNPPYNRAEEVARVALECTQDRVCLFLRMQFLEGQKRSPWLDKSPLARVWFFPDRVSCIPGHLLGQKQKKFSGSAAYAWLVWEHGHRGRPEIGWLFPEGKNGA